VLTVAHAETGRGRPIAWRLMSGHPHPARSVLPKTKPGRSRGGLEG